MKKVIFSFFIEPDLKEILDWLGINYKKAMKNRIILSLFFFSTAFFLGIYFKNIFLIPFGILLSFGYYKYQYLSIKKKRKNIIALKKRMFPAFVKKLLILIRTNNIYNAFLKMVDYTDEPIKEYLQNLIKDIETDKSIEPFHKFASKMEFIEAYQIMAMLYIFSEHSMNRKHLISLETMIAELYNNEIDEMIENKKRLLWLYPNFTIMTMLAMVFALAIFMFMSILSEIKL